MPRSTVLLALVVGAGLACAGAPAAPVPSTPRAPLRTGEPTPIRIVETKADSGFCRFVMRTLPGDGVGHDIGRTRGRCPKQAIVTWSGDRVLVTGDDGKPVPFDGQLAVPDPPVPVAFVSFDDQGGVHACAFTPGPTPPDGVLASWSLVADQWTERSSVAARGPIDGPDCDVRTQLPPGTWDHWLSTHRRPYGPLDWLTEDPADLAALGTLAPGAWQTDPDRLVGTVGGPYEGTVGPVALYLGDGWKIVHRTPDAAALWLTDDWLAVRTTGGDLTVISRRDGTVGYRQPKGVLAFVWPTTAPVP